MPEAEHQPGDPAPKQGHYEALNVFGRATGYVVEMEAGKAFPPLPRGFTWRRVRIC